MNDCIVTGKSDADTTTLFTLVSHDKGDTWKYSSSDMFPSFMKYPEISAVTFVNQVSIMLGNYRDSHDKDQLLFFVSKDKGNTWSGMPKIEGFPSKWRKNIRFDSMNCSDKNCFIAGTYDDQPMLLTSHDGAISWKMIDEENINDLPMFMENVNLSSLASVK